MNIKGLKKVGLGGLINSARVETDGSFRLQSEDGRVVAVGVPAGAPMEKQIGIFDLSKFMEIARMITDNATWSYDTTTDSLIVKDAKRKFTYRAADASVIQHAYNPEEGMDVTTMVTPETAAATITIAQDARKDLLNAIRAFGKEPTIVIEDRDEGVVAVFGDTYTQEIVLKLSDAKMNRSALVLPAQVMAQIFSVVDSEPLQIVVGSDDLPVMISDTYVKFYVFPVIM